ncbi:DAK2 domain-containing protein [Corynebacterium mendelii]|uniref:DAK2 domain-containing protein n=2 Tax=Corynebacterium mendelii TaxID=2765362 RepID=UPI00362E8E11
MSYPQALDGGALLRWARRAADTLALRSEEINALNVFPVPDADTGSNMSHTMAAGVAAADAAVAGMESPSAHAVAAALAAGAVRGARGNSGVVLSQILAGLAQAAATGDLDGQAVVESLSVAVQMVDRAITEPVEGTVITVIRATAVAASQASPNDLVTVTECAVAAARTALKQTPSQLEVLRKAGVVDAGGRGFVILLETLHDEITGRTAGRPALADTDGAAAAAGGGHTHSLAAGPAAGGDAPACGAGSPPHLEVMCFIDCGQPGHIDRLAEQLGRLGDSLVVARTGGGQATVHIHSRRAGEVITALAAAGSIEDVRLELLPDGPHTTPLTRSVIALVPKGRLAELYEKAGAVVVSPVHPDSPPLPGDRETGLKDTVSAITAATRASGAKEIILLPNGMLTRREMVSAELVTHATEKKLTILPTARLVSGIAALAVHDPTQPIAVDGYAMAEAAGAMTTAAVIRATAAELTDAGPCQPGDLIAKSSSGIITITRNLQQAIEDTVDTLLSGGGEMVTLLVTAEAAAAVDTRVLARRLETAGVDFTVYPADGMDHPAEIGVE